MKHFAFYYAIGFAVIGCLMLALNFSTIIEMVIDNSDPFNIIVLGTAMVLPFAISGFSWRDWKNIQRKKNIPKEEER